MESHVPTWEQGDQTARAIKGTLAYIEKQGEHDAKQLRDELHAARSSTIRLASLATKGQYFSFPGFPNCQTAVAALIKQSDRLKGLATIIGWRSVNWDNPDILASLKGAIAIDPAEIDTALKVNNVAIIQFARDTYNRIYG
jgi:hypothetical protein